MGKLSKKEIITAFAKAAINKLITNPDDVDVDDTEYPDDFNIIDINDVEVEDIVVDIEVTDDNTCEGSGLLAPIEYDVDVARDKDFEIEILAEVVKDLIEKAPTIRIDDL